MASRPSLILSSVTTSHADFKPHGSTGSAKGALKCSTCISKTAKGSRRPTCTYLSRLPFASMLSKALGLSQVIGTLSHTFSRGQLAQHRWRSCPRSQPANLPCSRLRLLCGTQSHLTSHCQSPTARRCWVISPFSIQTAGQK